MLEHLKEIAWAIPFYFPLIGILVYLNHHEKKHSRFFVYLKLICKKLDIPCDEKDT